MALLLAFAALFLAMTGHASCTWCVCKDLQDAVLQKTLDYACGAGADCGPIHSNGACFQPNTVRAHCSYAVNSFFQRKGQSQGSCDFSGTAAPSISDPSYSGCSYPATASAAGTSISTNTTTTTGPFSATPSNGVLGGIGSGISPTGINTDITDSAFRLTLTSSSYCILASLLVLWG